MIKHFGLSWSVIYLNELLANQGHIQYLYAFDAIFTYLQSIYILNYFQHLYISTFSNGFESSAYFDILEFSFIQYIFFIHCTCCTFSHSECNILEENMNLLASPWFNS